MASELLSRFHVVDMEPYTKEDFVVVAQRVLTMRENTDARMAKIIADAVAHRSLDIRDVVRFRRAVQVQMDEEVSRVE